MTGLDGRVAALWRQAELHPSDAAVCRSLAEALEREGRFAEAVRARRLVLERRADRPLDYFHLARVLVAAGSEETDAVRLPPAEEAAVALSTAIELDPDFGAAYRELARLDLGRARVLGDAAEVRKAAQRGVDRCKKALELDPSDAEAYRVLGELHFHVARDVATAGRCFARAVELDAGNHDARAMHAAALAKQGSREAALRELQEVLSAEPAHALANEVLGELR